MVPNRLTRVPMIAAMLALSGCAQMDMGSAAAKTEATGSAGGANSQGANSKLQHCDKTMGTIEVIEDQAQPWYVYFTQQYHLGSTTPVIKLLIQQSNCFVVVDRGRALNSAMQERQLAQSGEMRQNSNFGKGQIAAADYSLTPSITFSNNNAGGAGAVVGGLLGSVGALVGGSLSAKEASTLLTVVDNRSSVQLAAAEGSAKNWDIGGMGGLFGASAGGIGGGYSNTAEGKVIVAAFMDAYNGVVKAVRDYRAQTVEGGLGTGGTLGVQGGTTPASAAVNAAPAAPPAGSAPAMSISQAQAKLNTLGFNVGTPDGAIGPKTRAQIMKFQTSRGIPATGALDGPTITELSK